MQDIASRMLSYFVSSTRAFGVWTPTGVVSAKGKAEGKPRTVLQAPTISEFIKHLNGKVGLGLIPILSDSTCWWGAIDIDTYPLDHVELEQRVRALDLPLIVCRSKSGGAHLYVFLSEPTQASVLRAKLAEWMSSLGYKGLEIFPKQDKIMSKDEVGNWINMPYFGNERYAVINGQPASVMRFLSEIEKRRTVLSPPKEDVFKDAPPCLQTLLRSKVTENRNKVMFNVIVLRKNQNVADLEDQINDDRVNLFDTTDFSKAEVMTTLGSATKKDYAYTCEDPALTPYCDKKECEKRKYGVKCGEKLPFVIDKIVRVNTSPPSWIVSVNGSRDIEISNAAVLMDQRAFHRYCLEHLMYWPTMVSAKTWHTSVQEKLDEKREEEAPDDASEHGQFKVNLERYCTGTVIARTRDEITTGKAWHDVDKALFIFTGVGLLEYLARCEYKVPSRQVWMYLRSLKGTSKTVELSNKKVIRVWAVPDTVIESKNPSLPVPRVENGV